MKQVPVLTPLLQQMAIPILMTEQSSGNFGLKGLRTVHYHVHIGGLNARPLSSAISFLISYLRTSDT